MHDSKRFRQIGRAALFPLLVVLLGLAPPVCAAPLLTLSIDQPVRTALPGSTVVFTGTITNNSGNDLDAASDLFLNFTGFDTTALSFSQVLGNPDFALTNGATSPDVELFDALLDPSATPAGSPYLADVTVSDSLGDVSDAVTISITAVPEPGSLALVLVTLIIMIGFKGGCA